MGYVSVWETPIHTVVLSVYLFDTVVFPVDGADIAG